MSRAPIPFVNTSDSLVNYFSKLGSANTGGEDNAFFNAIKVASASELQVKASVRRRYVKGLAMTLTILMNLL